MENLAKKTFDSQYQRPLFVLTKPILLITYSHFYSTGKTLSVVFSSRAEIRLSRADSVEIRFSRAEILRKQTARAINSASNIIKKETMIFFIFNTLNTKGSRSK